LLQRTFYWDEIQNIVLAAEHCDKVLNVVLMDRLAVSSYTQVTNFKQVNQLSQMNRAAGWVSYRLLQRVQVPDGHRIADINSSSF